MIGIIARVRVNLTMVAASRVLENTDERLHTETSQDDGNPAEGTKKNGFSTGFDHSNEVGFETDSTHSHDDEEFGELFER